MSSAVEERREVVARASKQLRKDEDGQARRKGDLAEHQTKQSFSRRQTVTMKTRQGF